MKLYNLIICILISLPAFSNQENSPSKGNYNEEYYDLKSTLRKLKRDKWQNPALSGIVKLNDSSESVLHLKEYLKETGDLSGVKRAYMSSAVFDKRLEAAVKLFQLRHGLEPDGIAGEKTIEAMNIPLSERLKQIQANMERLKSFPPEIGRRYIVVNIPGFYMEYFDAGRLKMKMNVVVGEIENYTPMLHDTMSYIVFNPEWNVPESIAIEEILPKVKDDTEYLEKNNYILLKGAYNSTDTIPAGEVDWEKVDTTKFPFSFIKNPGTTNPLGKIKFMFPNNYNIYLHDTPADQLFGLDKRALSHGCIRLEKPFELAEMILAGQMETDEIKKILDSEKTTSVPLKNKVLVHITYQTAWIDEEGRLNLRDDIYGLDKQPISQVSTK